MFHGLRAYCRRYNSAMTTANDQPVEKLKFPMADAELYVGEKLKYNGTMIPADRLFVQHYTGNQDDALIFEQDGKRVAMNIRMVMNLEAPSPGGPVYEAGGFKLEETDPEDEKQLLAMYDRFENRTIK